MYVEVPKGKGTFPVVIFVHGGGFVHGDKSNFTPQTFALARKGIAGITIEYRLAGHGGTQALFMEDVMDAIDFVRKHAKNIKLILPGWDWPEGRPEDIYQPLPP